MNNRKTGAAFEDMACSFLMEKGYSILDRNYYWKHCEIDIVAFDNEKNELVFTEVKFRKNSNFGGAEYAISKSKRKNLLNAAKGYMFRKGYKTDTFVRFDCILITDNKINHIVNAW